MGRVLLALQEVTLRAGDGRVHPRVHPPSDGFFSIACYSMWYHPQMWCLIRVVQPFGSITRCHRGAGCQRLPRFYSSPYIDPQERTRGNVPRLQAPLAALRR